MFLTYVYIYIHIEVHVILQYKYIYICLYNVEREPHMIPVKMMCMKYVKQPSQGRAHLPGAVHLQASSLNGRSAATRDHDLQPATGTPRQASPRRSKYPIFQVSGSKTIPFMVVGARDRKLLVTWTLWVRKPSARRSLLQMALVMTTRSWGPGDPKG